MKKTLLSILLMVATISAENNVKLFFPGKIVLKTGDKKFVAIKENLFEIKKRGGYWCYENNDKNSTDFKRAVKKEKEYYQKYFPFKNSTCKVKYEDKYVTVYNDNLIAAKLEIKCDNFNFKGWIDIYDDQNSSNNLFEIYTDQNNFQLFTYKKKAP